MLLAGTCSLCCDQDSNFDIRESLREMLACCRVSTKQCLNVIVLAMLDNFSRYSEDRPSIWKLVTVTVFPDHSVMTYCKTTDFAVGCGISWEVAVVWNAL